MSGDCTVGDSLTETWFNPNCGLDIYETCDENAWVKCKTSGAKLGFYTMTPIIIIIVMLIIFFADGAGTKIIAVLIGAALIIGMGFGAFYWAERMSRVEYKRYENEVESYMKNGMNKETAIKLVRDEYEKRKRDAAAMAAATSAARIQNQGMFTIAAALRK